MPRDMTGVISVKSDMFVSEGDEPGGRMDKGQMHTHFFVHQPERDRLVSNKGLVVTLGVCDTLLEVPSVYESMNYAT